MGEPATKNILCKYFMHNCCAKGAQCAFSHNMTTPPDMVCRYFLAGRCSYGDRCTYNHTRPKKDVSSAPRIPVNNGAMTATTSATKAAGATQGSATPLARFATGVQSNLVPLKKAGKGAEAPKPLTKPADEWVKAPEFVPRNTAPEPPSYASIVGPPTVEFQEQGAAAASSETEYQDPPQPPYETPTDLLCEEEVIKAMEEEMEFSFAIARSEEKTCDICMDQVLKKEKRSDRRFGILENCNHCFCLSCIRQWRGVQMFEKVVVKSCPECRIQSNFVTPSSVWVDTPDAKAKVIAEYQQALKKKSCQYFKEGKGECPFFDKCFYLHALPDGTVPPAPKPRRKINAEGDMDSVRAYDLWLFIEEQETMREQDYRFVLEEALASALLYDSDSDSDED